MTKDISRRTVAKAAVWAVPAIAIAATVPAAAASAPPCSILYATGRGNMTTTSMNVTFTFADGSDPVGVGTYLRVFSVSGASFTGVYGSVPTQASPIDLLVTASPFTFTLTRSGDVDESGEVQLFAQVLSNSLEPCNSPTIYRFDYAYPAPNPNAEVTLAGRCLIPSDSNLQPIAAFDVSAANLPADQYVTISLGGPIAIATKTAGDTLIKAGATEFRLGGGGSAQVTGTIVVDATALAGEATAVITASAPGHIATVTISQSGSSYSCAAS